MRQQVQGNGGGGGTFFKWTAPGQKVEGRYLGLKTSQKAFNGRYPKHAVIVQRDGVELKVNTPSVLEGKLSQVPSGTYVWIEYVGDKKGSQPLPFKDFIVEIDTDETPTQQASSLAQTLQQPTYASLEAALKAKIGASAAAVLGALANMHKDEGERFAALLAVCKQNGAV